MGANRKNKYDDLRVKSPIPPAVESESTQVVFELKSGRQQVIDLGFFEEGQFPRRQFAEIFAWHFRHALTAHAPKTRDGRRCALRKFNRFLNWKAEGGTHISSTEQITSEVLLEYQLWLGTAGKLSPKSAYNNNSNISNILNHLLAHRPECLAQGLKVPASELISGRYDPSSVGAISVEDLGRIAEAALKEVRQIREAHALAKKLLAKGEERVTRSRIEGHARRSWRRLDEVLFYLVKEIGINAARHRAADYFKRFGLPSAVSILNMYAPVSDRNLIPFLVLLFIRTAINVETLYHLRRDCLSEHPLPLGLTNLKFDKPRAGSARNKALLFPTHQKDGVVDLINFLIEYTEPWVPFARELEKEDLFLFKAPAKGKNEIRSPGRTFAKKGLQRFIKDNNLPSFSFAQIRPTIATLIYLQTKDIFRVQRLLCHQDVATTIHYIKQEVTRRQHNSQIHQGIESIFKLIVDAPQRLGRPTVFVREIGSVLESKVAASEIDPAQAELLKNGGCSNGFARCRDPFDSPVPGEQKGRLCTQLHKCIFCPNAWVFEEDLPKVIYYRDGLLAERKNLTESAWDVLHGDAVREINEAILPSFSQKVVDAAEAKAKEIFAPYPPSGA